MILVRLKLITCRFKLVFYHQFKSLELTCIDIILEKFISQNIQKVKREFDNKVCAFIIHIHTKISYLKHIKTNIIEGPKLGAEACYKELGKLPTKQLDEPNKSYHEFIIHENMKNYF